MSPKTPVNIILGTHTVGDAPTDPGIVHFDSTEDVKALLDAFAARGHRHLDTAHDYSPNSPGSSEDRLGKASAPATFTIHTKVHSGPGEHSASNIAASIDRSLKALQTSSVETMFLHAPDRTTDFAETAQAMDVAFKEGKFKRFGLSNYSAEEVQAFVDVCEREGYVKPTVYQGHYNALVRGGEEELFPILRKHGISFFGYSPAAGGFFSGNAETAKRWQKDNLIGGLYSSFYSSPAIHASVSTVRDAAARHNIDGHAAAIRWTAFHGVLDGQYGDGIIFAVSKMSQLESTLGALEAGPLPEELAEAIGAVFETLGGEGPPYHL